MNSNGLMMLVDIKATILYNISKDIQGSGKWVQFGTSTNLTAQEIKIIEKSGEHFPAYEVMTKWYCKSPNVYNLATVLTNLELEKPLHKLKNYLSEEVFEALIRKIKRSQQNYILNDEDFQFDIPDNSRVDWLQNFENEDQINLPNSLLKETREDNLNEELKAKSTDSSDQIFSKSLETDISENSRIETPDKTISFFKSILERKSIRYFEKEFQTEDLSLKLPLGCFSAIFPKKIRRTMFNVQLFSISKLLESKKKQKKLYNIIWSLTNLRLYSLPILAGYYFSNEYLFLIYPHDAKSLFYMLHHSSETNEIISPRERLNILKTIGEALSFLHSFEPFPVYHGEINSENVLIGSNLILLSGFGKMHTRDTEYIKESEMIEKNEMKTKDFRLIDIRHYLQLIYETWWNVPQSKGISISIDRKLPNYLVSYGSPCDVIHEKMCKLIENHLINQSLLDIETILEELSNIESLLVPL